MEKEKKETKTALPLCMLPEGKQSLILKNNIGGPIETRLRALGFREGESVVKTGTAPLGDPSAYRIGGAVFAVRNKEAARITARLLE